MDAWVTAELERRVEAELAIARGGRTPGSAALPAAPPPLSLAMPLPPPVMSEVSPLIHSYAAQHSALRHGQPTPTLPTATTPTAGSKMEALSVGLDDADDNTAASPRLHLAAEAAGVAEAAEAEAAALQAAEAATLQAAEAEAEAAALQAAHSVSVDAAATVAQVEAEVRAKVEAEAAQAMADAEVLSRELEAAAIQHALNFSNIGAPGLAACSGTGTGGAGGGASVATANADGYFASGIADLKGENYDTVLGLLKECEEARKAERKRVDEAERDAQEGKTVHELALQELQLANLELRKKLRRLESESSHAPAFELYEAEISSLASKLQTSRTECAELEAMCREAQVAYAAARDAARLASGEQWPAGISATIEAKLSRVKNWRRALTCSDKELERLRQESAENAKKLRQGEVHKKSAEESTKRLVSPHGARMGLQAGSPKVCAGA